MAAIKLTRAHRVLVGIILAGAVVIAAIGFVGSYTAVRELAEQKGFGAFSPFFPIGIDAGIVVLLSLDLLLTWLRIPFPLLRQTAWLLTAATIAFNGAAAWGDPLGVGMHAIIPVLFVITVEAARHAIGRVADITADRHMEGVRMWRWLLSPVPTFRLWRRMKLWELRSYEEVISMERDRLVYQTRLRAEYGRAWRRRAPVEELMPLKLARFGVPLSETAPALSRADASGDPHPGRTQPPRFPLPELPVLQPRAEREEWYGAGGAAGPEPEPAAASAPDTGVPAGTAPQPVQPEPAQPGPGADPEPYPDATVPVAPGRRRTLGQAPAPGLLPAQRGGDDAYLPDEVPGPEPIELPADLAEDERYYAAFHRYVVENGGFPTPRQLSVMLNERFGVTDTDGNLLSEQHVREVMRTYGFRERYKADAGTSV
ncbi:DUF2637 domain-containing protein [Streptomyces sp. NPDC059853]|uniref:DUF2637 domain-containing protein n=1 Tax=Streptomyces sp. NPDC059853 TaxID=3346973 RepID=UPI0036697E80